MNKGRWARFITYSLFLITFSANAITPEQDTLGLFEFSPTLNHNRLNAVKYTTLVAYPVSMYWLYTQWYKNYPQSRFHFFNDDAEWLQMDKAGHAATAYGISKGYAGLLQWAGVDSRRAAIYGTAVSLVYQTTIEMFDGFSSQWGFSMSDEAYNVAGAAVFLSQELWWNEQRIRIKYSFHQTPYARYRPDQLGKSLAENWLKDYNGQTYWLSVNPSMFMQDDTKFPKWLSFAVGYGAAGMTGARINPLVVNGEAVPVFDRYRQYYLSLDVDLVRIKTKSKLLHAISEVISIIKIPAPTIAFNQGHATKLYWWYF